MAQPFRADHIGSLLRYEGLLEARASHDAGRIGDSQLKEIQDSAILDALEMQGQVGIDVFSDGEFRRSWFAAAFADSIEVITLVSYAEFVPSRRGEFGNQADSVAADIGFADLYHQRGGQIVLPRDVDWWEATKEMRETFTSGPAK